MGVSFQSEASVGIKVPVGKILQTLDDFSTWKSWSPWSCLDPSCPLETQGRTGEMGHSLTWQGMRIGWGTMTLVSRDENTLHYDLNILKPFKIWSKVSLKAEAMGEGARVSWQVDANLPYFRYFFRKMMSKIVSRDLKRGLVMLKDLLEEGEVNSTTEIVGKVSEPKRYFIGRREMCLFDEMEEAMSKTFSEMSPLEGGVGATLYHKFDCVKERVNFSSGFIYNDRPDLLLGYDLMEIPEHRVLRSDHTGSYRHLGNGWATTIKEQKCMKMRPNKKVPMYEIYRDPPESVQHERELLTEIYVPVVR